MNKLAPAFGLHETESDTAYYAHTAVQKLFHEAGFDAFCAGFSECSLL